MSDETAIIQAEQKEGVTVISWWTDKHRRSYIRVIEHNDSLQFAGVVVYEEDGGVMPSSCFATRDHVRALLPILQRFADTGELGE
jgi:hypothetical protein